jgi:hypothetical protein
LRLIESDPTVLLLRKPRLPLRRSGHL